MMNAADAPQEGEALKAKGCRSDLENPKQKNTKDTGKSSKQ